MEGDGRILLREVTVRYGRRLALEAVSGEFAAGSLTAVVGANGAGKSTLLAATAGIVRPVRGVVSCPARRRLAYLPQLATLDRDFPLTVAELIALGGWRDASSPGARPRRHCRRWRPDVGSRAPRGAVRDPRLHAVGAGRVPGAGVVQRRHRDVAGAAADEPRRRCVGACGAAGRGGRV